MEINCDGWFIASAFSGGVFVSPQWTPLFNDIHRTITAIHISIHNYDDELS